MFVIYGTIVDGNSTNVIGASIDTASFVISGYANSLMAPAHELGHSLELEHKTQDRDNLMRDTYSSTNKNALRYEQWNKPHTNSN